MMFFFCDVEGRKAILAVHRHRFWNVKAMLKKQK
jgi:hypothetical protein